MIKYYSLLLLLVSFCITSCSDNNDIVPAPEYGWGKTMKGNDPNEITWPDLSENYWEYTLNLEKHPKGKVGLRFKGEFPNVDTRFFNFTLYSDRTTERLSSIEDFNIEPNSGDQNPFKQDGITGNHYFEVNAIPNTADGSKFKNVITFPESTERLTVLLRIYFNSIDHGADFGGVTLPELVLFDVETGEEIGKAQRAKSLYYIRFAGTISRVPAIESRKPMVFTLAPNVLYGNGPTGYVTSVNRMHKDSTLMFRFIPPRQPNKVSENLTADVRYWSICIGDTTTHTPATLVDKAVVKSDDGYVNFMIVDPTNEKYSEIKAKAQSMKINVINWEVKKYGEPLMIFYRQMYINPNFAYSVQKITPYPELNSQGQPDPSLSPIGPKNLAHIVLGEHGPSGLKHPVSLFLSDQFNYGYMRLPLGN